MAGLHIVQTVLERQNPTIRVKAHVADGKRVYPGDKIASVYGPARNVLKAEWIALDFLQHMSGIATATADYVKKLEGTKAQLLDTRKTLPGHRMLDKLAVRMIWPSSRIITLMQRVLSERPSNGYAMHFPGCLSRWRQDRSRMSSTQDARREKVEPAIRRR